MKTKRVVSIAVAGVAVTLSCIVACSSMTGGKAKKVVIEDQQIFIPGTAVSVADQNSVLTVLRQYKTSLYKIHEFKDGNRVGKPHGSLPNRIIGEATVAQVISDAKQGGLTGWGIQIGASTSSHPTQQPTPSPGSSSSSHPTSQPTPSPGSSSSSHPTQVPPGDEASMREMVSKVAPVLRKYSQ